MKMCLFIRFSLFFCVCFGCTQGVQIAQRLEQLSVTREEYYLLKALVLINCDVRVESMAHVKKLRESVLSALSDCASALRYHPISLFPIAITSITTFSFVLISISHLVAFYTSKQTSRQIVEQTKRKKKERKH